MIIADNRYIWREWLRINHATAPVVWLLFWRRHTGKVCIGYEDAVEEALCYGWIDGVLKPVDHDSYVRRFSPRTEGSTWSSLNRERALELIRKGLMQEAGMNAVMAARESGAWYAPPEPVEMPCELLEELDRNAAAALFFAELAPSYRKLYMRWVADGKRPETRLKRAREACLLMERGMKLPMK
jgi:uncharacterized protein YdeI (YjbR/CyaY-like superfamily)